ncbi:MAG: T9SS type A sorting domain-containing protein [candidate division WOR-3 bacterium]|nr:T9SS type A sorting domain-containing protein [candidate division WOR-3 bacterium]
MFNIVLMLMVATLSGIQPSEYLWVECTQQDFKDGAFEHNLYASHRFGGAVEFVPRFDLNNDGFLDLFVNQYWSSYSYIYWGDSNGYSINRRTIYNPGGAGGNCDAADLNKDGYADFVVSRYYEPSLSIFWGTENGPDPNNQTDLALGDGSNETGLIADFNKDGYLDIAIGNYCRGKAAVIWGSASGYSINNRTELPVTCLTGHNLETADFNKDNWLDLLIANRDDSSNIIYWGSENGFSASNHTDLPFLSNNIHGTSVADLNGDRWLDLVFTGCGSIEDIYIYWGSESGFQNHQELNPGGPALGGSSVSDLNGDGYLDILYIKGEAELKPLIYWGSRNGYSNRNRTEINTLVWGSGGFIADFNYDGQLDIYLDNFAAGVGSYLFWGPNFRAYQVIPCEGRDHHAMFREVGNTYNRKYCEDYISSVFDAGFVATWKKAFWSGYQPTGAQIQMFLRSGNTSSPDSTWTPWIEVTNGRPIPQSLRARYLQYMAKLGYTNPSYLPALDSVKVSYQTQTIVYQHDVGVIEILEPLDTIYAGSTVTPTAVVKNFGSFYEDCWIFFNIGCEYSDFRFIGLEAGEIDTVTFDPWLALTGYYNEGAATYLETDENPENDTVSEWLTVIEVQAVTLFKPYPNPTPHNLAISFTLPNQSNVEITVYNINGQTVKTLISGTKAVGNYLINTDCRGLKNGVYFVKMKTDNFEAREKFVVIR